MANQVFDYTGDPQKFTVPNGVKILEVVLEGGGSGTAMSGRVTGRIRVEGGDVFWVRAGRHGYAADGREGGAIAYGGGGAGGRGSAGNSGGRGGGGASSIRKNAKDGKIIAVAGGAGGRSGDAGDGGRGGAEIGEGGSPGNSGTGLTHNSTGGTQNQGGKGGTSNAGLAYSGKDAPDERLGRGGRGGEPDRANVHGGGGGGGGFYAGGGGQAAAVGDNPGGGGAGGSNFYGGLYNYNSNRSGTTDHGFVKFVWEAPGGNEPPTPAQNIVIDGQPIADGLPTKAVNSVVVKGTPDDPNAGQGVRMYIQMSTSTNFASKTIWKGTYDAQEKRDKVTITGLSQDARYWLRIYTQDNTGKLSLNYTSTNFWTNRKPSPPTLIQPGDNSQFSTALNTTFIWNHVDVDPADPQTAFKLRFRRAPTPVVPEGPWTTEYHITNFEQWVIDANTLKGNTFYEWQVQTRDSQDHWGTWSDSFSFYAVSDATAPIPLDPTNNTGIVAADERAFRWKFLTPNQEVTQANADVRYRVVDTVDWAYIFGTPQDPGAQWETVIPGSTFEPGYHYEWQVRTHSSAATVSDWSDSAVFWATAAPGSGAGIALLASGKTQEPLGIGNNRVYIYERGGIRMLGELTPLTEIIWGRRRDDISTVTIRMHEWSKDGKAFLGSLRSWMHEVVVFRDGVRVWEGPITRISGDKDSLEIDAKDVMVYVYRRIMRQGYNDAHRIINGTQVGLATVVQRASQIILNALAYDDPNVLPYLTPINYPDDARTSRAVKDYSRTAWEEVDDLAATAGLDYATIGRRIVLWDTHRAIGRLPEMRDGDFSNPPIVTEYGMSFANVFGVTNGNGIYGVVTKGIDGVDPGPTGFIEQLASAYGESEGAGTEQTMTREARRDLEITFRSQADRNISGRSPIPLVVRVPDNSSLNPELNIGINQLIPGVFIPIRSSGSIREVRQWQKLDSMTVTQDSSGEKIAVVMSPAPNQGEDPDATNAAVVDGA